mgnify:CR=1 FL=1
MHPVTSDDLRAVFAADDRAHIEIGTVYPTDDIRGALYVDAMLSKHFAVLGSTGTGKSTSVALILQAKPSATPDQVKAALKQGTWLPNGIEVAVAALQDVRRVCCG